MILKNVAIIFGTLFQCSLQQCVVKNISTVTCKNIIPEDFLPQFYESTLKEKQQDFTAINVLDSNFTHIEMFINPIVRSVVPTFQITNITISSSGVEQINERAFRSFGALKFLDLRFNNIRNISFATSLPNNLEELYLGNNKIEVVEVVLVFPSLTYLDLSSCGILDVNFEVFKHVRPLVLNLSHNELEHVNLTNLNTIKEFDFSFNKIKSFNVCLKEFNDRSGFYNTFILEGNNVSSFIGNVSANTQFKNINVAEINLSKALAKTGFNIKSVTVRKNLNLSNNDIPKLDKAEFDIQNFINNDYLSDDVEVSIDLSNSGIHHISEYYFRGLPLKMLDLSFNNLKNISSTSFSCNITSKLIISNANLTLTTTSFDGLNCEYLILTHNKISSIKYNSFGKAKINSLDLSFNPIEAIENYGFTFKTLQYLNLSHCKIVSVKKNSFKLENLQELDLSDNFLKSLDKRIFSRLTNIQKIFLQNNKLVALEEQHFSNMEYLNTIHLFGNDIKRIQTNAFFKLNSLIQLTLGLNNQSKIEQNALNELQNLRNFEISVNKFDSNIFENVYLLYLNLTSVSSVSFDKDFEKFTIQHLNIKFEGNVKAKSFLNSIALETLNFVNSEISNLANNAFKGLYILNTLTFTNSNVYNIEPNSLNGLFSLTNLDSLNLFKNVKRIQKNVFKDCYSLKYLNLSAVAKNIESFAFRGLDNLNILDLSYNKLSSIKENTFEGLRNLKLLNLSSNNFEKIQKETFKMLESLQILRLDQSNINNMDVDSFKGLSNLVELYLQNNNISEIISGTFRHFPTLSKLNLSRNNITELKVGSFSNLPQLKFLDLSHNKLNDILIDTFFPMKSLKSLNLETNHLKQLETSLTKNLKLNYIGLAENKWKCEELGDMLGHFQNKNITYHPTTVPFSFHTENIDGISCVDICNFVLCPKHTQDYHMHINK